MKPSRSRDKSVNPFETPEERARLLVELDAELEAAERSIKEEGTISAKEFLEQRAKYWGGNSKAARR